MGLGRRLHRGLRALFRREAVDREIADEVRHFLDEATAERLARGLPPAEARRAARLELGSETAVVEQVREVGWQHGVETTLADLRYAVRRLRAEPVVSALTVLTLALGIGAVTAIFSVVAPILVSPLPYPHADRLVVVQEIGADGSRVDGTFGMFRELAARSHTLAAVAVFKPWRPATIGAGERGRVQGQRVSGGWFEVLGVGPALGRGFAAEEERPGGAGAVVLSDGLWRRRYGGDRAIVGRTITLDDTPYVVVGVMPAGFENVLAPAAELWAPLQYDMTQGRAWGHHLRTVGRLEPGVSAGRAARELDAIGKAVVAELHPETYQGGADLRVVPLRDDVTRAVRPALLALAGAVVLVLAIACVNVVNLQLGRGVRRRRELALRAALGAGRPRLVRQLVTESLLLALVGGVTGVGVAVAGVRALVALSPLDLPRVGAIAVDRPVLFFALGVTLLVGVVVGSIPARRGAGADPLEALQEGSPRTAGGPRRARGLLVVAEVALALVLLVGSGLLLRSLERLFAVAPGFDPEHRLTLQVQISGHRFDDDVAVLDFFDRALAAVRSLPGVEDAALTSQLPLSGDEDLYGVRFEPPPPDDPGEVRGSFRYAVSPGYLEAMGIPLRRGRDLEERDRSGAPRVALISEATARRRLPGLDPIGRRIQIGGGEDLYTVVGVVGDVRQMSLAQEEADAVYVTAAQWPFADAAMSLVVRATGDPEALAPAVRRAIWSVDDAQPIARVATMEELVARSAAERRFAMVVLAAFALAALVLAAAGIYGVLAAGVAERTREIGVRTALGATRSGIVILVVGRGMALAGLGAAIGLAAATVASRGLGALLFGVTPLDPATYAGVVLLLVSVAAAACAVPAWRAAQVDPVRALRAE